MSFFKEMIVMLWRNPRWHLLWCWPLSVVMTILLVSLLGPIAFLDWLYETKR